MTAEVVEYESCLREAWRDPAHAREARFGELLAEAWCRAYAASTPWRPEILEVPLGRLRYLFDAAPSSSPGPADDRVVGVWGWSSSPIAARDTSRMTGFIQCPERWSGAELDRGHFVSHAAGGGTDLNLFPQATSLNRGRSSTGRRWRELEREIAERPGTFLFVRPTYHDASWIPATIDLGLLRGNALVLEHFTNGPTPSAADR